VPSYSPSYTEHAVADGDDVDVVDDDDAAAQTFAVPSDEQYQSHVADAEPHSGSTVAPTLMAHSNHSLLNNLNNSGNDNHTEQHFYQHDSPLVEESRWQAFQGSQFAAPLSPEVPATPLNTVQMDRNLEQQLRKRLEQQKQNTVEPIESFAWPAEPLLDDSDYTRPAAAASTSTTCTTLNGLSSSSSSSLSTCSTAVPSARPRRRLPLNQSWIDTNTDDFAGPLEQQFHQQQRYSSSQQQQQQAQLTQTRLLGSSTNTSNKRARDDETTTTTTTTTSTSEPPQAACGSMFQFAKRQRRNAPAFIDEDDVIDDDDL
jgi:hypothetical protein